MKKQSLKVSRRQFLRGAAYAAVGGLSSGLLAACANVAQPVVVRETVVVSEGQPDVKEVRIARCGWLETEMPLDLAIATYNNLPERAEDKVQIVLDPAGKSATDPVLGQMIASGERMIWNTHACFTPFLDTVPAIKLDTIQPLDPFLETTRYKEAANRIKAEMIGSVKADNSFEGKLYSLPTNVDVVCFMYRSDYVEGAGMSAPTTMDELLEVAKAVKDKFADQKVFGFAPTPAVTWRYIAALHQAYSTPDRLFTKEGLLNILDDGWIAAMEITKKFIDAGTVPEGWETWGYPETWKQGKVAAAINQHSMGTWGGMIWGYDKLRMMPTPVGNPDLKQSGTMFWSTSIPLFKAAPYPQETVDFLVWLVDPDNELWYKGAFKAGKMSGFKSTYTKYIDQNDVTQNWAFTVLPLLEAATPPPPTPWYLTQHNMIVPKLIQFLKGEKTAKAAMEEAATDIKAEVSKGA